LRSRSSPKSTGAPGSFPTDAVAACKAGLADKEAILGGNLIKLLRLPA
jgi:hypothetical protein